MPAKSPITPSLMRPSPYVPARRRFLVWTLTSAVVAVSLFVSACARGPAAPLGKLSLSLDDGRISAAARSALVNDPELGLREIGVAVHQGVVTLSGSVRSAEEAERALEIVRQADGVKQVRSELRIVK